MQQQCSDSFSTPQQTRDPNTEETALPPLRRDLRFHPVQDSDDHTTWMLYDPLRGQYLELGELELRVLHHWDLGNAESIATRITSEQGCAIDPQDVVAVARFAKDNELLLCSSEQLEQKLAGINPNKKRLQALQKTLFWRRPLFTPDFSSRLLLPLARCTAYPLFYLIFALLALACMVSVGQHLAEFLAYFNASWNTAGAATFFLCYLVLSLFHELGHASVARLYSIRANSVGVGLIALMPIMFSEITDAWRLPRRARLHISAAGVLFEATLGVAAALAWCLLDDGPLRSLAFYLFTTSLITTLLINANPLMKFDGYYLLSDYAREKNLQQTATTTMRQWIWLLLLRSPTPGTNRRQKLLILFGMASLLYRLSVFALISYAAYQLLFKAAGVLILIICIGLLLVIPAAREFLAFTKLLKEQNAKHAMQQEQTEHNATQTPHETSVPPTPIQRLNNYLRLLSPKFLGGLAALAALLLTPLPWPVQLPASTFFSDSQKVMAPAEAVLESLDLQPGSSVTVGKVIARLHDSELEYRIARIREELKLLQRRQSSDSFAETLDALDGVYLQDLLSKRQLLRALETERQQLKIVAKVSGSVDWILPGLHTGQHLDVNQPFISIVDRTTLRGRAYGQSQQITRLTQRDGGPAHGRLFLTGNWKPVPVTVAAVEQIASRRIQDPALASDFGGPLQTIADEPERSAEALHLINFSINVGSDYPTTAQRTGHLVLFGKPVSLLKLMTDRIAGVVIRESGV